MSESQTTGRVLWSGECSCGCGAPIVIAESPPQKWFDRRATEIDIRVGSREVSVSRSDLTKALSAGHWYRFDNPGEWTCGVKVREGRVVATGPTLQRIIGWEFGEAMELARESGWTVENA